MSRHLWGTGTSFFPTSDKFSNRTEAITVSEYGTVRYQRERKKIKNFYLPNRKKGKIQPFQQLLFPLLSWGP